VKRPDNPAVVMPAKTTRKIGANGTIYIYETTRAYRNARGKPTSDEVAIGKLAPDGVSLIPNERYYDMHPDSKSPRGVLAKSVSFGDSAALCMLGEKTGVFSLLESVFLSLSDQIALAAVYMVIKGNVMWHITHFCEESFTPYAATLDSGRTSELFGSIGLGKRKAFSKAWIAHVRESDYIAYDVTSLSTCSGGIEDAEWGHNRDGEDLTQINLGMFLSRHSRLPVHYVTYQGSILDKSHLKAMMAEARALGIGSVRFVFDRGFVTKENIAAVSGEHLSFITALSSNLKEYKRLTDMALPSVHSSANRVEGENLYAVTLPAKVGTTALLAHVFYSPLKAADEEQILWARIARLEGELEGISKAGKLPRRYSDLFKVKEQGARQLSFARDTEKIDAAISRLGFFVLVTNDERLDSAACLAEYRGKDVIEKAFSGMKNHIDFKRMRTHTTPTTDGKLFCGFIALILRSAMATALASSTDKAIQKMPVTEALRELAKLKRVTYADGSVTHTVITKTQSSILTALGIDPDELLAM